MKNLNVRTAIFASTKIFMLLCISFIINSTLAAKIETKKLLYLREALSGKTTDKARLITLAGVTALAAAQLGLTTYIFTCWQRKQNNEYCIKDPSWREYWYKKFNINNRIAEEQKAYLNADCPPPPEGWDAYKEKYFIKSATIAFIIPMIVNLYFCPVLMGLFYQYSTEFRPTTNLTGLKYPFLAGFNSPGVALYWICQKLFFDYRHNLINLLKNYDREKIPTIFLPTFDKLAAEYKAKGQLSMDKELQHFFVLSILKQIQEELLEEVTILSFPHINNSIEKILNKIKIPQKKENNSIKENTTANKTP